MHPMLKLVFLLCLFVLGLFLSGITGLLYSGISGHSTTAASTSLVMGASLQLFACLTIGLVYHFLFDKGIGVGFTKQGASSLLWLFLLMAIICTYSFAPFLDLSQKLNNWLINISNIAEIPFFDWLIEQDNDTTELSIKILSMDSPIEFISCLIVIGLLPAICEEYAFRGSFQPLIAKWSGNIHVGIWVSAFIFSAIHVQILGFIPRMLLGAGFGYLVVASGSLWTGIIGHFINNTSIVIMAYYMGVDWVQESLSLTPEPWGETEYITAAVCGAIIIAIAFGLSKISVWRKNEANYLGLEQ